MAGVMADAAMVDGAIERDVYRSKQRFELQCSNRASNRGSNSSCRTFAAAASARAPQTAATRASRDAPAELRPPFAPGSCHPFIPGVLTLNGLEVDPPGRRLSRPFPRHSVLSDDGSWRTGLSIARWSSSASALMSPNSSETPDEICLSGEGDPPLPPFSPPAGGSGPPGPRLASAPAVGGAVVTAPLSPQHRSACCFPGSHL